MLSTAVDNAERPSNFYVKFYHGNAKTLEHLYEFGHEYVFIVSKTCVSIKLFIC